MVDPTRQGRLKAAQDATAAARRVLDLARREEDEAFLHWQHKAMEAAEAAEKVAEAESAERALFAQRHVLALVPEAKGAA